VRRFSEVTKRYDEPIDVDPDPDPATRGAPVAFRWRGRRYQVDSLLSEWRETSEMWDPSRSKDREYHRVLARPAGMMSEGDVDPDGFLRREVGAVYDVYRDRVRGDWRLARIWD
jgi:hypothetical protein